jgi:transposase
MYHITVPPTTLAQLAHHAQQHPHPIIRRRMFSVQLIAQGHTRKAVAQMLQITPKTVRDHLRVYRQEGITGLLTLKYPARCGALDAHRDQILAVLEDDPPATVKEARARIADHLHITRCYTQVRLFLKKIGASAEKSANCRIGRIATPK